MPNGADRETLVARSTIGADALGAPGGCLVGPTSRSDKWTAKWTQERIIELSSRQSCLLAARFALTGVFWWKILFLLATFHLSKVISRSFRVVWFGSWKSWKLPQRRQLRRDTSSCWKSPRRTGLCRSDLLHDVENKLAEAIRMDMFHHRSKFAEGQHNADLCSCRRKLACIISLALAFLFKETLAKWLNVKLSFQSLRVPIEPSWRV